MVTAAKGQNFWALTRRILLSTFCLTLAFLIAGEVALRAFNARDDRLVDDSPRVKLFKKIFSSNCRPDAVVLGSSLAMSLYNYDREWGASAGKTSAVPVDPVEYWQPLYLSDLLSQSAGRTLSVINLGWTGGMVTDAGVIMSRAYQSGQNPALVLYLISRRDFVDRLVPPVGAIGGAAVLNPVVTCSRQAGSVDLTVACGMLSAQASQLLVPEDLLRRLQRLGPHPSCAQIGDCVIAHFWSFYEQRGKLKEWLVGMVCDWFHRDANLWNATAHVRAKEERLTLFDHDLLNYNDRYNPPDFARLKREFGQLETLINQCRSKGAGLVIINMPITAENKALIDKKLDHEYCDTLRRVTAKYGVPLIDFDGSKLFNRTTFRDSVHLNARGGKIFQDALIEKLKDDSIAVSSLEAQPVLRISKAGGLEPDHTSHQ